MQGMNEDGFLHRDVSDWFWLYLWQKYLHFWQRYHWNYSFTSLAQWRYLFSFIPFRHWLSWTQFTCNVFLNKCSTSESFHYILTEVRARKGCSYRVEHAVLSGKCKCEWNWQLNILTKKGHNAYSAFRNLEQYDN